MGLGRRDEEKKGKDKARGCQKGGSIGKKGHLVQHEKQQRTDDLQEEEREK